ncbi:MAG TPA: hypothetical protein PKA00_19230 [Saprospiraceae bacterium]|mgnify:CR=1 FL=1|nr:hypothetical protein [Saprospiraceae bacterium]HMQ85051.1 hypothetical protein [Saprospiraceae bacterium]
MRSFCVITLFLWFGLLQAQESLWLDVDNTQEIGLNITGSLSGFFNSGGQNLPSDPYLFTYKSVKVNRAFRLGIGGRLTNRTEFAGSFERNIGDQLLDLRLGKEWRQSFGRRFMLFYGLDLAFTYAHSSVEFTSFPDNIVVSSRELGAGGGPAMGILFHISPRVSVSTESFLYAFYLRGREEDPLDDPFNPAITTTESVRIEPVLPSSIYVIVKF